MDNWFNCIRCGKWAGRPMTLCADCWIIVLTKPRADDA